MKQPNKFLRAGILAPPPWDLYAILKTPTDKGYVPENFEILSQR